MDGIVVGRGRSIRVLLRRCATQAGCLGAISNSFKARPSVRSPDPRPGTKKRAGLSSDGARTERDHMIGTAPQARGTREIREIIQLRYVP